MHLWTYDIRKAFARAPYQLLLSLLLPLGALNASDVPNGPYTYCQADGKADTSDCLMQAFAITAQQGEALVTIPVGLYGTTKTIVVPHKMLNGTGRGDPGGIGTTISLFRAFQQASP